MKATSTVLRRLLARRAMGRAIGARVPSSGTAGVHIFVYRDRAGTDPSAAWRYSIEPVARGAGPLASGTGRTKNAALANARSRVQGLRLVDDVVAVHRGVDRQGWEGERGAEAGCQGGRHRRRDA